MAAARPPAVDADAGVAADAAEVEVDCARGVEGGGDDASNRSIAKMLHDEVMADVEAVLKKKEDLLWSRGRVELQSLREERAQVVSTLGDIQERQDQLINEHSQMRGTLMDITMRLGHLAREMRDSFRVEPQQQPGVASDSPFDSGYDAVDAGAMAQFATADVAFDGPRTPTRAVLGSTMHGSPAVRLSLASALEASVTATPPSQQSAKRLAIAECLDFDGPSDSTRKPAVEAAVGSAWQPADYDSPTSFHTGPRPLELSPVLDQAAGGQLRSLRAEAPAFVPGAGFASADNSTSGGDAVLPAVSTADTRAAPAGLKLEPPPAKLTNEEALGDPLSP